MPQPFRRTPHTWLLYLALAIFAYVINILGPVTPFLKSELHLTYTVSSLLFSAFATGMILTGLVGHRLVSLLGRSRVLWAALFGMCLSAIALALSRSPWLTVCASLLTGFLGSLVPSVTSFALAGEHGEQRSVALSESNLIAAISSAGAPLLIGWFSYTWLGWRFALLLPLGAALLLGLSLGRRVHLAAVDGQAEAHSTQKLPARYWLFWVLNILAVALEYCMLSWCADYLENVAGLPKALSAQAVSIFLLGMVLGRLAGSALVHRFNTYWVVTASLLTAAAGFALFWSALSSILTVAGLFIAGLGVANQFPMALSLALGASGGNMVRASTQSSLASGIAIFSLPLVLGRLADAVGIRLAYGVVALLLIAAFVLIRWTASHPPAPATSG